MNIHTNGLANAALDTAHLGVDFPFKPRYGNFINGEFTEPRSGQYFENTTPITGEVICEIARSNADDVNAALDAAHAAFPAWGRSSTTERSAISPMLMGASWPMARIRSANSSAAANISSYWPSVRLWIE